MFSIYTIDPIDRVDRIDLISPIDRIDRTDPIDQNTKTPKLKGKCRQEENYLFVPQCLAMHPFSGTSSPRSETTG